MKVIFLEILCPIVLAVFIMGCGGTMTGQRNDDSLEERVEESIAECATDVGIGNLSIGMDSVAEGPVLIEMLDSLIIYYPQYSRIDLVCGERPSKNDSTVIFMAEAAFTGQELKEFKHSNIAGDHVSAGTRYPGYRCARNTGAFFWYGGKPRFLYSDYSHELDKAAANGGCGFGQEMLIHDGKIVKHTRPDNNINEFRALCLIDGKVAVADSYSAKRFGDFIDELLAAGATEALYLDMGFGWNYSWYRDVSGAAVNIHSIPTKYATNWITFYR